MNKRIWEHHENKLSTNIIWFTQYIGGAIRHGCLRRLRHNISKLVSDKGNNSKTVFELLPLDVLISNVSTLYGLYNSTEQI